jgi:hypothetical protein
MLTSWIAMVQWNLITNVMQVLMLVILIWLLIMHHRRQRIATASWARVTEQVGGVMALLTDVSKRQLAWMEHWAVFMAAQAAAVAAAESVRAPQEAGEAPSAEQAPEGPGEAG